MQLKNLVMVPVIALLMITGFLATSCTVQPDSSADRQSLNVSGINQNAITSADYSTALTMAINFYDANKCGTGVAANNTFSWRGNCHTTDPIATGFHDAGDHVKFSFPAAYTFAILGWSLYEYPNSFSASDTTKLRNDILKRFSDYFIAAYNKTAKTFVYQIAEPNADHGYWGAPELQSGTRQVYINTTSQGYVDAGSLAAAGLAMMYLHYKNIDLAYANQCLDSATNLYFDVKSNQKYYLPQDSFYGYNPNTAPSVYDTLEIPDKLALAADFLYLADPSKRSTYYADMKTFLLTGNNRGGGSKTLIGQALNWNNLYPAAFQVAYENAKTENNTADMNSYFYAIQTNNLFMKNTQPNTTESTGNHMVYMNSWGSCKLAAALSMTVMLQTGIQADPALQTWAKKQVDYILGDNANNFSYMIGFGPNYPKQPHHRGANPNQNNATYVLSGGLVSGPNNSGQFTDSVYQYQYTEVALDYNATMIGALAAVIKYFGGGVSSSSSVVTSSSRSSVSSAVVSSSSSTVTSSSTGNTTGKAYAYGLAGVYGDQNAYMQAQYEEWRGQYVTASGAGGNLRVQRDAGSSYDTVSEGIGYGMILAALYNDRPTLDGLFKYSVAHRDGNLMMNWHIDQYNNTVEANGATDADEDIAFALVYASKAWGNTGAINYGQEATTLINALMNTCIEPGTYVVKAGDTWGGSSIYNPSYFAPSFYRVFKAHTGDSRWDNVIAAGYAILDNIQTKNAGTGFSPDWCTSAGDNCGKIYDMGYDAIRVPYRIGLDWSWYGITKARDINNKFIKFFDNQGTTNNLRDGYTITGTVTGQWWTPTFASMIASAAMSTNDMAVARKWYDISKNKQDPYSNAYHYFGSCLRMLNLTYMIGNFQNPLSGISSSSSVSSIISSSSRSSVSSTIIISSSVSSARSSSRSSTVSSVVSVSSVNSVSSQSSVFTGGIKAQTYQNGAVIQNQVNEKITLVNTGSTAVALSTVKVRYYIKNQGATAFGFNCDYSPVGAANVVGTFSAVTPATASADTYNEISFTAAAGSLAPNASVEVQCRFWKNDWSNIDNSLNYSYNPSLSYIDWNKVTVFVNGSLVWGIAPGASSSSVSSASSVISSSKSSSSISSAISSSSKSSTLSSSSKSSSKSSSIPSSSSISSVSSVSSKSSSSSIIISSSSSIRSSSSSSTVSSTSSTVTGSVKVQAFNGSLAVTGNQVYPRFKLINTGTAGIVLSTVKIRYYFTADGTAAPTFWCDWTGVGTANVIGTFAAYSPAKPNASSYLDIAFTTAAGSIAPGASIEIQGRFAKSDWSNFDQSNDYSFNSTATSYVDWTKVTASVAGTIQWGVAP